MIIKVILLGICVCFLNIFLRQNQSVFTYIINIAYIVIIVVLLSDGVAERLKDIKDLLFLSSSATKMLSCLYKGALICILTKISSDVCKESGNLVVSDIIDLAGRIMLLIIAFPFIESIIKTASAFVL